MGLGNALIRFPTELSVFEGAHHHEHVMYAVVDPSTGDLVKEYPTATDEQIEQAVAAAAKAHREWSRSSTVADRAALIRKVGELHTAAQGRAREDHPARDGQAARPVRGRGRFQRGDLRVLRRQRREVPRRRAHRAASRARARL